MATSRFPDGVYVDVKGLCKVVSQSETAENDYSLTPEDIRCSRPNGEDFDYKSTIANIKKELDN